MDTQKNIFCAFAADELAAASGYHGNGETFVASITPEFNVFPWVSGSDYVMSTDDLLAFGGDGKFALWFDSSFQKGAQATNRLLLGTADCRQSGNFGVLLLKFGHSSDGIESEAVAEPSAKVKFKPFSTSYV